MSLHRQSYVEYREITAPWGHRALLLNRRGAGAATGTGPGLWRGWHSCGAGAVLSAGSGHRQLPEMH